MRFETARSGLAATLLVAMCGCTIMDQRRDNEATQQRIVVKEGELHDAKVTRDELLAESQQLKADLRERQFGADELRRRLDHLIVLNQQMKAESERAQAEQAEYRQQLQEISQELRDLQRSDTQLNDDDRRKKLAALQEKTRQLIEILVVS